MPRITVTQPFNYRHGLDVKHYKAGTQHVPAEVAKHIKANGFDKPETKKPAAVKAATTL